MSWRSVFAAVFLTAALANHASAEFIFQGLPSAYVPGTTFSFDLWLIGAQNLNSYNIDLTMTSSRGIAGVDFFFHDSYSPVPTARPTDAEDAYVFDESHYGIDPLDLGFLATAQVDDPLSPTKAMLNLSDFAFDFSEVTTDSQFGKIATIYVTTTAAAGPLTLAVDETTLFLDDSLFQPIPNYDEIEIPSPASLSPVPEPSSLVAWAGLAGVGLILRCRRRLKKRE